MTEACRRLGPARVADLPLGRPLEATPAFRALLMPHLHTESVPAVLRFIKSALRLAEQGTAARGIGEVRSLVQRREEVSCVSLEAVLGYSFNDPQLERTARIHSCAPLPSLLPAPTGTAAISGEATPHDGGTAGRGCTRRRTTAGWSSWGTPCWG